MFPSLTKKKPVQNSGPWDRIQTGIRKKKLQN